MKRTMRFFMMVIAAIFLVGCTQTETTTAFPFEYSDYSFYSVKTYDDQLNYTDGTYYIYYYSESCPACISIKGDVLSLVSNLDEDTLLLFDVYNDADININPSFNLSNTPSLVKVTNNQFDELYVGVDEILPVLNGLQ